LIAPAAVLVGWAVEEHLKRRSESAAGRGTRPAAAGRGRLLDVLHWAVVGTAAVALPVVAATRLAPAIFDMDHVMADWRAGGWAALAGDADLRPWLAPVVAVPCAAAAVVLLACGVASSRFRRPAVLVVATFLCAVLFHALYEYGRRTTGESASDMKPMADFIWRQYPDARVYATGRERTQAPVDLNIYLNRPVPPHDTVADLRPAAVPTVVVVFQSRGEAEPASPLRKNERPAPGVLWSRAASFRRGNNWCHAFVLPARQRS
jgi:hypothetical protein